MLPGMSTDAAVRAPRLSAWPMALLAAAFYTLGMVAVWQFAEHDYEQTAELLRDVILALAVLVLLALGLAWWSRLTIHRSNRLGWFGMVALIPVLLMLITFVFYFERDVRHRRFEFIEELHGRSVLRARY